MKKYFCFLGIAIMLLSFVSCNKEGYKAPVSNTVEMSGRWWSQLYYDADGDGILNREEDVLFADYADVGIFSIVTTNDAANSKDSIWLDDRELLPFKIKIGIDSESKTFKPVSNVPNVYSPSELITLNSGKIMPKAATTLLGAKADSIFFSITNDVGDTYFYSGIKYTGHTEDDYH